MVMHRLLAQQLRENQPLPWDVYDGSSKLLLRKGFVIDKYIHLPTLIERGAYVKLSSVKESLRDDGPTKHYLDPWRLWEDIQVKLGRVLKKPPTDMTFTEQIEELGDLVRLLSERSTDVALAAIMLMEHGRHHIIHSLHCAVMADLVANHMGWDLQQRKSLCCAALTMNISMLNLQQALYNQSGDITAEQKVIIKGHPEQSFKELCALGVRDATWLQTVLEHHEQVGGIGYPRGLESPSSSALLLRTVDIYCAKVSPRAHREAMLPNEASKILFTEEGKHDDNPYPAYLIKQVGIYPPGSFVKLVNGETGVVLKRGNSANTPLVYSLVNEHGQCLGTPIKRDTSMPIFQVNAVIPRKNLMIKFDPRTIWKPNFHL